MIIATKLFAEFISYLTQKNDKYSKMTSISFVKLNYIKYKSSSSNTKLNFIVIHGLFGSKDVFSSIIQDKKILKYANCYVFDLRNHGDSPNTDTMTISEMTEDVFKMIENLNLKHLVLMGHSIGGRIAMQYCLKYPENVKGIVVIDVMPIHYPEEREKFPFVKKMQSILTSLKNLKLNRKKEEIAKVITKLQPNNPALVEMLISNLVQSDFNSCYWKINIKSISKNYLNLLRGPFISENNQKFGNPVLVIFGEKSLSLENEDFKCFNKIFKNFTFEKNVQIIKDAKHWVHYDNPQDFLVSLSNFLANL